MGLVVHTCCDVVRSAMRGLAAGAGVGIFRDRLRSIILLLHGKVPTWGTAAGGAGGPG